MMPVAQGLPVVLAVPELHRISVVVDDVVDVRSGRVDALPQALDAQPVLRQVLPTCLAPVAAVAALG